MSDKDKLREQNLLKVKDPGAKVMNIVDHHQEEDFKNSELLLTLTGHHMLASLLMVILQEEDYHLNSTCASLSQKKDSQYHPQGIL